MSKRSQQMVNSSLKKNKKSTFLVLDNKKSYFKPSELFKSPTSGIDEWVTSQYLLSTPTTPDNNYLLRNKPINKDDSRNVPSTSTSFLIESQTVSNGNEVILNIQSTQSLTEKQNVSEDDSRNVPSTSTSFLVESQTVSNGNEVILNIQSTQSLTEKQNVTEDNLINFDDVEFVILEEESLETNRCNELPTSDLEYIDEINTSDGGRKKKTIHQRQIKKKMNNTIEKTWQLNCIHKEKSSIVCQVSTIGYNNIDKFKYLLASIPDKTNQDRFLLDMMSITNVQRKDRRKTNREDRLNVKYFIPNANGEKIRVCLNAFSSITTIKRKRLNLISKTFKKTCISPTEKRGGARKTAKTEEITNSIIDHIHTFKSRKSHHTRTDSSRSYLQPELSVNIMFNMWKTFRQNNNQPVASFSKYYHIFVSRFNISFGHPRQDVCSYCTEVKKKIKEEIDPIRKEEMKFELQTHSRKSQLFFQKMASKSDNVISVSFDMMQTQPLPKLSVTDVFYSRQVWLYNITFVINSEGVENPNTCYTYTWLETESGRGPDEVCSALMSFLTNLENKIKLEISSENYPKTLNLFSDSCSAQNKNKYMITTLLYYVNYKTTIFNEVNHIFPVRGHSYMPPDRVFGKIEQNIRKKEIIVSPNQYYEIFKKESSVYVYGKDFVVYNYKNAASKLLKSIMGFKSTEQKCFSYIKGLKTVGVSPSYTDTPVRVNVLKRNVDLGIFEDILEVLPKKSHVKDAKRIDVANLMKFFTVPSDAKEFYEDILQITGQDNAINDEEEGYYDEDEQ